MPEEVVIKSICPFCKHKDLGSATCAAFPEGIPIVFLDGDREHRQPFAGDHGIQFEAIGGQDI